MAYACHGLFYREGQSLADGIAKEIDRSEDLLVGARRAIIARGWVEDIQFGGGNVRVKGSIEVSAGSESETCHRLRGMISRLFEIRTRERVKLTEIECQSTGKDQCLFALEVS